MQNKPNFPNAHNDLNSIPEKELRKILTPPNGKKQTQTNPIQSQFKPNFSPNKPNFPPQAPGFMPGVLPRPQTANQFSTAGQIHGTKNGKKLS